MKTLERVNEKEQIANNIKIYVDKINKEIELSNNIGLRVEFIQNERFGLKNPELCCFISEKIVY